MKLIVSEKPSVSRAISAILGATQKKNGYLEGNGYLVSWCVGHLVELAPAASYDESYAKWRKEDLPILPDPWQYKISEGTKQQFTILKQLMQDPRVESLICATDAGREGELIFRLVYLLAGCKKPVQRLWISSMEDSAIREGFERLKPASEYDALYQAALCRAQADWLVGINATRHFSLLYGQTLHIGRVMTPTLALLVEREAQIAAFRPTPFYHVALECGVMTAMSERLTDRAEAERIESVSRLLQPFGNRCAGNTQRLRDLLCFHALIVVQQHDLLLLARQAHHLLRNRNAFGRGIRCGKRKLFPRNLSVPKTKP